MSIRYNVSILILSLLSILFVSAHEPNDDISIIRQRVLEQMIWPSPNSIPAIVESALWSARTLNSSCYWPDVNYTDQGRAVWLTAQHMTRVTTMLQALTVNGSRIIRGSNIRMELRSSSSRSYLLRPSVVIPVRSRVLKLRTDRATSGKKWISELSRLRAAFKSHRRSRITAALYSTILRVRW